MNLALPGLEEQVGSLNAPEGLDRRHPNRGFMHYRTFYKEEGYVNRELVFAEAWEEENKPHPGVNQGHGVLQNLFFRGHWTPVFWVGPIERWVAATVVQWLGTNCGFCFLEEVLKKCGYKLLRDYEYDKERERQIELRHKEFVLEQKRRQELAEMREKIKKSPNPWVKRKMVLE